MHSVNTTIVTKGVFGPYSCTYECDSIMLMVCKMKWNKSSRMKIEHTTCTGHPFIVHGGVRS